MRCTGRVGGSSEGRWKVLFPADCENPPTIWTGSPETQIFDQFSYMESERLPNLLNGTRPMKSDLYVDLSDGCTAVAVGSARLVCVDD